MKVKWLLAAAVALLLCYGDLLPFENRDAGEMCIVETLFVEQKGAYVALSSGEIQGMGKDLQAAAENMEENAPGGLFLRQVKRILFCQGAEKGVDLLKMPEELPLGAAIYRSDAPAEELLKELETMEKRLEAKEQRERDIPTLARIQNQVLKEAERENE